MRIYYESDEFENEAAPGTFAGITIAGDDDSSHFIFGSGDNIIFDLAIPACEALAISYALSRSGKRAIRAAERETAGDACQAAGYSQDELAAYRPPAAPAPAERAPLPAAAERVSLPRAADRFETRPFAGAYDPSGRARPAA